MKWPPKNAAFESTPNSSHIGLCCLVDENPVLYSCYLVGPTLRSTKAFP